MVCVHAPGQLGHSGAPGPGFGSGSVSSGSGHWSLLFVLATTGVLTSEASLLALGVSSCWLLAFFCFFFCFFPCSHICVRHAKGSLENCGH